jgi:hypothetical protein
MRFPYLFQSNVSLVLYALLIYIVAMDYGNSLNRVIC